MFPEVTRKHVSYLQTRYQQQIVVTTAVTEKNIHFTGKYFIQVLDVDFVNTVHRSCQCASHA